MAKEITELICPVCGRTIHKYIKEKRTRNKAQGQREKIIDYQLGRKGIEYLDYLEKNWNPDKSFYGFVREARGGRGAGFPIVRWLEKPEDDPERFNKLKRQLLRGLEWWIKRGWITKEEVEEALKEMK